MLRVTLIIVALLAFCALAGLVWAIRKFSDSWSSWLDNY